MRKRPQQDFSNWRITKKGQLAMNDIKQKVIEANKA